MPMVMDEKRLPQEMRPRIAEALRLMRSRRMVTVFLAILSRGVIGRALTVMDFSHL